jgi:hypothetical protein
MRLENNRFVILIACCSWLTDYNITYIVALPLQLMLLGEVNQKLNYALLLF